MSKQEEARFELQQKLDNLKTQKERNEMGQFSTPYNLACEITRYALSLGVGETGIRFLEPSAGTGVFYSALSDIASPEMATGYEIDPHYALPALKLWDGTGFKIIQKDFFLDNPTPIYNLILANPPYCRHHHLSTEQKVHLREMVKEAYGLTVSGLSGLYCYFLILATRWLEEGGLSCWLIPSEFMEVNYGKAVREFLVEKVELLSIHKFKASDLQFSDALVSSSVVIFRNRRPKKDHAVLFSSGEKLLTPDYKRYVGIDELNYKEKWSSFFADSVLETNGLPLGHYFRVTRGVSTGNNKFFIVPESTALSRDLPREFLAPILPSPKSLHIERIEKEVENLPSSERFFLISCPLDKTLLKDSFPNLYNYVIEGENLQFNSGYNCSRREPWYNCELRKPAPLYMTYMGRGENYQRMFRFILNESDAIVSNSYLMLYPRNDYTEQFKSPKIREQVWSALNNIPKERLTQCGRTYGGGLIKIEPKELESLKVPELEEILKPIQLSLFDDL